jgi:hypothetical protein
MISKNVYIISGIIFFLGFIAGGVTFSALHVFAPGILEPTPIVLPPIYESGGGGTIEPAPNDGIGVVCIMDGKLCPDGSTVGRVGPDCEFAECPPTSGTEGACQRDSDCDTGYVCLDPSPVVREGYQNLRCWKKGAPLPICLSGDTRIGTPRGDISVKDAKDGMSVWTIDKRGQKTEAVIILTGKTPAPIGHKVVHLRLSDGRNLYVSSGHKIADGRKTGELKSGDTMQGATVLSVNLIPYTEEYTHDILPSGYTGKYFANGILLQSTLR